MKKSEIYQVAMIAVLTNNAIIPTDKLEIIAELMDKKETAEWLERVEDVKQEENNG